MILLVTEGALPDQGAIPEPMIQMRETQVELDA